MSLAPLPFPATVIASRTDHYMRFARAPLAAAWGAGLVDYGDAGHINAAAGFGPWPDGPRLLAALQARRRLPHGDPPAAARRSPGLPGRAARAGTISARRISHGAGDGSLRPRFSVYRSRGPMRP